MKISELMELLGEIQGKQGDLDVMLSCDKNGKLVGYGNAVSVYTMVPGTPHQFVEIRNVE